ncbi:hypothetical protein MRBBS_0121 [Marinobacter sp. BSs20148]|nr:hypothetical protein MRBBS_0121 [Marinobacter sp. BSs20148]
MLLSFWQAASAMKATELTLPSAYFMESFNNSMLTMRLNTDLQ